MPPVPSDDYGHGQMMGMLVIIQMFENARDTNMVLDSGIFEKVKRIAVIDLSEYLKTPEEDVYLLVDQQLKEIK